QLKAAPSSLISKEKSEIGVISLSDDKFPTAEIRSIAFHESKNLLAVTADDKSLSLWNTITWERLSYTFCDKNSDSTTIKRLDVLKFSIDGELVIVGDKFGNVYSYPTIALEETSARLLLGHVSMITDLVRFMNVFVATAHIPLFYPTILISGGGDSFLGVWEFSTGKLLQKYDFSVLFDTKKMNEEDEEDDDAESKRIITPAVVSIKSCNFSNHVAVLFEKYNKFILTIDNQQILNIFLRYRIIEMFTFSKDLLIHACTLKLEFIPLSMDFDSLGKLVVTYHPYEGVDSEKREEIVKFIDMFEFKQKSGQ
ncbi:tRNA (guanine-N(7)-)-methyltransferase non-catalytic subunit trm82, partial [Nowakowskiella sp. JEL0078]